jgi:hypothetical protein
MAIRAPTTHPAIASGPVRTARIRGMVMNEHRLVYAATETELIIIQARYHYSD